MDIPNFIPFFLTIAGLVIGLGAVTVIDLHGFLGRKSRYWTRATITAHKITKPLIWIGTILFTLGVYLLYPQQILELQLLIILALTINGYFLTFHISPLLLEQEKSDDPDKILPRHVQHQVFASFAVSFIGWWGSVVTFAMFLTQIQ